MSFVNISTKKRILFAMVICLLGFVYLTGRLVYIQIVKSEHYTNRAYAQQTRAKTVEAKRGTIYDSTGAKILAQSISTNIVTAVPNNISADKKDEVAQKLADVLEINKDEVLSKLNKNVASVTIATQVNEEKANEILTYILKNEINGISVDEDMLRIYPYGTLLSHVLGFVGTDNQGLSGIEAYYDSEWKRFSPYC